ncbi:MAG: hypothetical protein K0U86_20460 [Planctomycetes bacterium]|nr:hypothetical protein [Planctomycetota bacterium]MCH9779135.1 hypothetical protein [Planctomycetota bacterium]MCH9792301.1 hypothetical protein [Planctomycetota bacterium]
MAVRRTKVESRISAAVRICQKNRQALDSEGGGDVKIGFGLCLERFQAQPKWEIPAYTRLSDPCKK